MAVVDIRAAICCDGCGVRFSVRLDPASHLPAGQSLFDAAVDAVRGSVGLQWARNAIGPSSVQAQLTLCPDCTNKVAAYLREDRMPTLQEALAALGER
jgi:hypothetical protein